MPELRPRASRPARAAALTLLAIGALAPLPAHAHFALEAPASNMSQDALGAPEKLGPCGDEVTSPPATPTGVVTTYQEGDLITVTVNGIIPHAGHWRVALGATGPGSLPAEPVVTAGSTPCGSAAIEDPAVYPVLGDNLLPSTAGFTGMQSFQIQLPAGVTCTKCTLQVIQFMSDHPLNNPGGCYYHHCADISIVAASDAGTSSASASSSAASGASSGSSSSTATAGTGGAAGSGSGAGGGTVGEDPVPASGCGCSVPASRSPALWALAGLLGLAALRRRQRRG